MDQAQEVVEGTVESIDPMDHDPSVSGMSDSARSEHASNEALLKISQDMARVLDRLTMTARVAVLDPTRRPNPIQDAVLFSNPIPFSFVSKTHFQCSFFKGYFSL